MANTPPILIGVIGGGEAPAEECATAKTLGRLVAGRGALLVCGGLGGIMEAAGQGAREAGGTVIGILPGKSSGTANPWVTVPLATGLGEARNTVIATASHGLIAVGGEWGTLSEIAFGKKLGKPVVAISSRIPLPGIPQAASPQEALDMIWKDLGLTTPDEKD